MENRLIHLLLLSVLRLHSGTDALIKKHGFRIDIIHSKHGDKHTRSVGNAYAFEL